MKKETLEKLKVTLNLFKIGYSKFIHDYYPNNEEMNNNKKILNTIKENIEDIEKFDIEKAINFITDTKNKIELLKTINLKWDTKISEIEQKCDIWLEDNETRKKLFSELKSIKAEFTKKNDLLDVKFISLDLQLILDRISKDLQAEVNTTLRGNKVQECNKVIIQLTNCKDALSIIKPTKLKEISKEYNSLRTEISSKIKFFEELSRNSFPSKTVNNTKPNDSSNDIEPINANNCL